MAARNLGHHPPSKLAQQTISVLQYTNRSVQFGTQLMKDKGDRRWPHIYGVNKG